MMAENVRDVKKLELPSSGPSLCEGSGRDVVREGNFTADWEEIIK
jgi:hypothetical protein